MDKNKTDPIVTHESHVFDEAAIPQPKRGSWKVMLPVLILLIIGGYIVYRYHFNPRAAAVGCGVGRSLYGWLLGY